MATGNEKLQIDITAKDNASKPVDALQKKVDKLENSNPTVTITGDTKKADRDVDAFAAKLKKLAAADQVVALGIRAAGVESELSDLLQDVARLDSSDPTIEVKLDRVNELTSEFDQLETKIKEIRDTPLDQGGLGGSLDEAEDRVKRVGTAADGTRRRLAETRGEADQSRSVLANMAGNAAQDLGEIAGQAGTAGVALGQVAEYAADGSLSLAGMAAAAPAMLLLGGALSVIQRNMAKTAEIKAFNEQQVKSFLDVVLATNEALRKTAGASADIEKGFTGTEGTAYLTSLSQQAQQLIETWQKAGKVEFFDPVKDQAIDLLPYFAKAKLGSEQVAEAVAGSQSAYLDLIRAIGENISDEETQRSIIAAVADARQKYTEATRAAAQQDQFFATAVDTTTDAEERQKAAVETNNAVLDEQARVHSELQAEIAGTNAEIDAQAQKLRDVAQGYRDAESAQKAMIDGAENAADSARAEAAAFGAFGAAVKDSKVSATDAANAAIALAKAHEKTADDAATAAGQTRTQTERIDSLNTSLANTAAASKKSRSQIVDYIAELNGIEPEKKTEIQALFDQGKVEEAKKAIDDASTTRKVAVEADASNFNADVADAKADAVEQTKIPVDADTSQFDRDIAAAKRRAAAIPVRIPVTIDQIPTGSGAPNRTATGAFIPGGSNYLTTLGEDPGAAGDEVVLPLGNPTRMRALLNGAGNVWGRIRSAMSIGSFGGTYSSDQVSVTSTPAASASTSPAADDAQKAAERAVDNQYRLGVISAQQYKQILQSRLGSYEQYSDEYTSIALQIRQIDTDQTKAAAAEVDNQYRLGLISVDQYKQILADRMGAYDLYGDDYTRLALQIRQIDEDTAKAAQKAAEDSAAAAKKAAEDALAATKKIYEDAQNERDVADAEAKQADAVRAAVSTKGTDRAGANQQAADAVYSTVLAKAKAAGLDAGTVEWDRAMRAYLTAAIGNLAGTGIEQILARYMSYIPALAQGGFVPYTPGGTLALIGEQPGTRGEHVVRDDVMQQLVAAVAGLGGARTVNVTNILPAGVSFEQATIQSTRRYDRRNGTRAGVGQLKVAL